MTSWLSSLTASPWLLLLGIMLCVLAIAQCANRLGRAGVSLTGLVARPLVTASRKLWLPVYHYLHRPAVEVLHDTGRHALHALNRLLGA